MEITHCDFKIIYLDVLLEGVIASPLSSQSGPQAGKSGMLWHRHISGKTGRIQISEFSLITAQFISSTADSLFTKRGVDSSRSVSTWTCLIPATCILHFFTVLKNTVQNTQPNESSFLSFQKANDPRMICSCCIKYILKKSIYLWFF